MEVTQALSIQSIDIKSRSAVLSAFDLTENSLPYTDTVSKINHGIFQCSKYLRGDASLRIRLMRASPETSIDCATAATGKTFEPVEFRFEEYFMLVRRIVVNPEISQTHQNLLSRGNKLLYSYIDTHMVSYNINSGSMNHISESLQIGPLPNMLSLLIKK
ncbi:unnamed protein product [Orchesella dallaii]|uniref:Uncharacterized protein n=1 Tax=Orchesella dallaii TaxID=48710 RepID=A0ABP1QXL9_9HEXA